MASFLRSIPSPTPGETAGHARTLSSAAANGKQLDAASLFRGPAVWPGRHAEARYCPMLAVDITAFSTRRRGEEVQRFLRSAMYDLLTSAFTDSGLWWHACHHEDRGDGVLVIAPPGAPTIVLIDPLVDHLRAGIRRHNKMCSDLAKIYLRMAVHAGHVHFDENGVSGSAVIHLFRMLEAATFKRVFKASGCDFGLITSHALYEDIISQGPGLIDPGMYAPIDVRRKETRTRAWLYLPPVPNPFLASMVRARAGRRAASVAASVPRAGGMPATRSAPATGAAPMTSPRPRGATSGHGDANQPARPPGPAGPRPAEPHDKPWRDSVSARARLIAASAVTRSQWLAAVPRSSLVQARVRERLHPGQRLQHV